MIVTEILVALIFPMVINPLTVWSIATKMGKRNAMILGSVLFVAGGAICGAFPENMPIFWIT